MGKNRNRPARAIEPFRRASRPGTLQSYYGGKNKSRPANLCCKGASCRGVVGRCHKHMEWAQTFRPLLGSILDKSRPFWGAGQTSPGLSATSWAHLGGRGKQVQAFRPLLRAILGGGENKSRPFRHFLGLSWGAGQSSPGLSATSWDHVGGRGKEVQAFRPLLGPFLGGGQTRPLRGGQTSPGLSATSWALFGGWGKQVQAFRPLLGPTLGGGANKSTGLSASSGGGANKSRPFGHFLGPSWGVGQTSPALSATSWAHLGGWGKQVLPIVGLFGLVRPALRSGRKACGLVCPTPQDEPKKSEGLNGKERQRRGVVGRRHKQMEWARSEKGGLFLFFPIAGL